MLKEIRKHNKGFTIIETMIVLAIAGLILLIVLLAVPALQRASRNNSRKQDASAILSGLSTFDDNNGGQLPLTLAAFNAGLFAGAGTTCNSSSGDVKLAYYSCNTSGTAPGVIFTTTATAATFTGTSVANQPDTIWIATDWTCGGQNNPTQTGASLRSFAAVYWVETSGAPTIQCDAS
jgi:prepilin-type N-terminal cleavage/methylation domain-containing protein